VRRPSRQRPARPEPRRSPVPFAARARRRHGRQFVERADRGAVVRPPRRQRRQPPGRPPARRQRHRRRAGARRHPPRDRGRAGAGPASSAARDAEPVRRRPGGAARRQGAQRARADAATDREAIRRPGGFLVNLTDVCVPDTASLREVLELVNRSGKQIALVVASDATLAGLVTDGDVRKAILRGVPLDAKVVEAMNRRPIVGRPGIARAEALTMMRQRRIRHLPLVDAGGRLQDVLLLDDLLAPLGPLDTLAVVMAGGEGRRLLPLTQSTPKPLIKIGGKPLVEILIDRLREAGIREVLVSVHHKSDMIRAALGDGERLGVRLEYVEEPRPLGTMGALALVRHRLDRPVFVINGDILTKCDFRAMWEFHRRQTDAVMTVGVSLHQVELPFGELTLDGNRVERVDEKPRKEYPVNAGIYILNPAAIDAIPEGEYCDATDLIRMHLDGRRVAAYAINEYWLDVGRHGDLERAIRDVAEGLLE